VKGVGACKIFIQELNGKRIHDSKINQQGRHAMSNLVLESTATAQIQALVREGADLYGYNLDEMAEHYLVSTLERTLNKKSLLSPIIAKEYLESKQEVGKDSKLRDVGDCCLIFTGLFPGIARKRLVPISYFVKIGQSAYMELSDRLAGQSFSTLYEQLAREFVLFMDILQSLRDIGGLNPLTQIEEVGLWHDCRSMRAYQQLRLRGVLPAPITKNVH